MYMYVHMTKIAIIHNVATLLIVLKNIIANFVKTIMRGEQCHIAKI